MAIVLKIVSSCSLHGCYMKSPHSPRVKSASNVGHCKIFYTRVESFALSIVQIPTYSWEGWGGALH